MNVCTNGIEASTLSVGTTVGRVLGEVGRHQVQGLLLMSLHTQNKLLYQYIHVYTVIVL